MITEKGRTEKTKPPVTIGSIADLKVLSRIDSLEPIVGKLLKDNGFELKNNINGRALLSEITSSF